MIQQTIFPFKMTTTKEVLTARGGLALFAEYNHGMGLPEVGTFNALKRQRGRCGRKREIRAKRREVLAQD